MSDKAAVLPLITHTIPDDVKTRSQWVAYKQITRGGKLTKVPINPDMGTFADTTAPSTWGTFAAARERQRRDHLPGIGYAFSPLDPYCGVDLDKCRDAETGKVTPWARAIIADLDTWSDISPSATGVKLFVRGALPPHGRHRTRIADGEIEVYDSQRFFAVTGHRLPGTPTAIHERQPQLDQLYRRIFDEGAAAGERVSLGAVTIDGDAGADLWAWAYPRLSVRMMRVANREDADYACDASRGDAALILALRRMGMTDGEAASAFAASPRGAALEARKPGRLADLIKRALENSRKVLGEVVQI